MLSRTSLNEPTDIPRGGLLRACSLEDEQDEEAEPRIGGRGRRGRGEEEEGGGGKKRKARY